MNRLEIVGNITREVELRTTAGGKAYCYLTIAVSRPMGNGTDFIEGKVWGELAESCVETLKKGQKVSVIGRLNSNNYEKEGKKVYSTDIVFSEIKALAKSANVGGQSSAVQFEDEESAAE